MPLHNAAAPFYLPLGLCVIGYLAAFLCWAQLFRWWALAIAGVLLVAWSWREVRAMPRDVAGWFRRRWPIEWRTARRWPTLLRIAGWGILLYLVLLSLVFSFAPPHQSDALRYHLAVPKVYIQNGGFVYLPHNAFSNFPFTVDMLYGVAMMFCSGSAARGVHWLFLVIALFAIYHFGKRYRNADTGLLAALLFATIPYVALIASWAFIEVALAAMVFLSVYALILWSESIGLMKSAEGRVAVTDVAPRPPVLNARTAQWLFILSAGFSMGLKYTSVFVTAFLLLAVLVLSVRKIRTAPWRQIIVTFALAGVVASPWYVKNLVVTGNPVFPLANGIFQADDWSKVEAELYYYHAGMKGNLNQFKHAPLDEKLEDLATLPVRAVAATRAEYVTWEVGPYESFRLTPEYFGDWPTGWAPLVLFPALLLFRRWNRLATVLLVMIVLLWFFWAFTYRDTRFLLPTLSLVSVVIAIGLRDMWEHSRVIGGVLAGLTVVGIVYAGLGSLQTAYGGQNVLPVVSGMQSEDEFLASRINSYRAMQWLNENAEGTVILHMEHRLYYLDIPYIGSDFFNTPVVWKWRKAGRTDEQIIEIIGDKGEWMLFNAEEQSIITGSFALYKAYQLSDSLYNDLRPFEEPFGALAVSELIDPVKEHVVESPRLQLVREVGGSEIYRIGQ